MALLPKKASAIEQISRSGLRRHRGSIVKKCEKISPKTAQISKIRYICIQYIHRYIVCRFFLCVPDGLQMDIFLLLGRTIGVY